jgi:hypothetical protein
MLHVAFLESDGIVTLVPRGSLTRADFERLSAVVDPYISAKGALKGLLIDAVSFPGWESLGALMSHLEFVMGHHSKVARVAIVSDSELLKLAPHIAKHVVAAEIQQFPAGDKARALAWLKGSPG